MRERWQNMSEEEREEHRAKMRAMHERMKNLPEDERRELRQRLRDATPEERREILEQYS